MDKWLVDLEKLHARKEVLVPTDLVAIGLFPTENAVRIAVHRGLLPAFKVGARLKFRRSEIYEFLESKRIKTDEELSSEAADFLMKRGAK